MSGFIENEAFKEYLDDADDVAFFISPNLGEELKPLAEIDAQIGGRTLTTVDLLDKSARVKEMAQMMSREMLSKAGKC